MNQWFHAFIRRAAVAITDYPIHVNHQPTDERSPWVPCTVADLAMLRKIADVLDTHAQGTHMPQAIPDAPMAPLEPFTKRAIEETFGVISLLKEQVKSRETALAITKLEEAIHWLEHTGRAAPALTEADVTRAALADQDTQP